MRNHLPGCEIHPAKVAPGWSSQLDPVNVGIQSHAFPRVAHHIGHGG
jgi:hypothetical protein